MCYASALSEHMVKILIVEDEPATGNHLRQGLSEAGARAGLGLAITQSIVAARVGATRADTKSGEVCSTIDLSAPRLHAGEAGGARIRAPGGSA